LYARTTFILQFVLNDGIVKIVQNYNLTGKTTMSSKLSASVARQQFSDILSRAEYRGERVIVHRGKKAVAAVVPIEDVDLLQRLEEELDLAAARDALKDPRTIPWETIKKKLKL
jgi:prevent-host-death family protein